MVDPNTAIEGVARDPGWSLVALALYWVLRHEIGNGKTKRLIDHALKKHEEAVAVIRDIAAGQQANQAEILAMYDPEEWEGNERRIREIHEVVVTGDRKGAIPQTPRARQ